MNAFFCVFFELLAPTSLRIAWENNIHYMATMLMLNPTACLPEQYLSDRVLEKGDVLLTEIMYACRRGPFPQLSHRKHFLLRFTAVLVMLIPVLGDIAVLC
jgi:hypothetical protein